MPAPSRQGADAGSGRSAGGTGLVRRKPRARVAAGAGAVCETGPVLDWGGAAWSLIVVEPVVDTDALLLLLPAPPQPAKLEPGRERGRRHPGA